jgi:hypothetical protein
VPFKFNGKLNKLTFSIKRPKLTPEESKEKKGENNSAHSLLAHVFTYFGH